MRTVAIKISGLEEVHTFWASQLPHHTIMKTNQSSTCRLIVIQVREKAFREMKKDVGMTTAQKSKEMEMGSIFVLYIQPTIPTYTSGSFR